MFPLSLTHHSRSIIDFHQPFFPMNPPEFFSGGADAGEGSGNRPSPRKELQGPRPTALKVNKDSHKIRKPPVAPPPHNPQPSEALSHPPGDRQPVIIYSVSPKVIHTTVSDFMKLVQRLTGNTTEGGASSSAAGGGPGAGAGDLSPAARLASIERTSPRPSKDREITANSSADNINNSDFEIGDFLEDSGVELAGGPGILSPAPASLPPVSPGFFSPAGDPFMMGYNMFIPSPSTLFSAPMVSPSPSSSSCDLFNPFFDF